MHSSQGLDPVRNRIRDPAQTILQPVLLRRQAVNKPPNRGISFRDCGFRILHIINTLNAQGVGAVSPSPLLLAHATDYNYNFILIGKPAPARGIWIMDTMRAKLQHMD